MDQLLVRHLGLQPYQPVFAAMKAFTARRDDQTPDELWWVEHEPVFTQGQAGRAEHLLMPGEIPVVQVDRGGQVTYHGPGQLVGYPMIDVKRRGLGVRQLVTAIENAMIDALTSCGIASYARADAPGVYVADGRDGHRKIGSLGIRVRKGCSYHGLSLNVAMDLSPYRRINPCGYQGLEMTQVRELVAGDAMPAMADLESVMLTALMAQLGYDTYQLAAEPTDIFAELNL